MAMPVREFQDRHCWVYDAMNRHREGAHVMFFTTRLRCAEPMSLAIHAGYDGPFKVWLDGRERFCDPAGDTPMKPYMARVPVAVSRGRHTLTVALGSNHGWATAIVVNVERLGVPPALRLKGQAHWRLPVPKV